MSLDLSIQPQIRAILGNLRSKQIEPSQLRYDKGHETLYGRFSFVRRATLDNVRVVAVKALPPAGGREDRAQLILRLARELSRWEPLSHLNILPLTGFHVSDDYSVILLVSPWAAGGRIEEYIKLLSPDLEGRIGLALDTAAGLKYLHDRKICHADLKSRNVVILDNGCAVLRDFGIVNAIQENAKQTGFTTTSIGSEPQAITPYTSPEMLLEPGASPTLASDIWAWGCLLLEILTGICPYASYDGPNRIYDSITTGKPPANIFELQLPSDLRTLLLRCWNVRMDDRPAVDECFTRLVTAEVTSSAADQLQPQNLSNYQQVRILYSSQRLQRLEGESSLAEEALSQAKDKLLELENPFGVLWCDSTLASVERSKCHYDFARVLQEKVLETFQDINASWGVASARYELGTVDAKQGKHDAARTRYHEALEIFQHLGDPSGVASCHRALGIIDCNQGRYQDAQTRHQGALEAFERLGDESGAASCRYDLGIVSFHRGKYEDARDQLVLALETFRRCGDHSGAALCSKQLGTLSLYQGRRDEARSLKQEALEAFEKLGDISEAAWCQRSIGLIDCDLKKYDDAHLRLKEALETFQKLGNLPGVASCHYDRGVIASEEGDKTLALMHLRQALEEERRLGNLSGVAYCQLEIGGINYDLGRSDKARLLLQEALRVFQLQEQPRGIAGCLRMLGQIDYDENNSDVAKMQLQQALEIYQQLDSPSGIDFCQTGLRIIQDGVPKTR